MNQELLHLAQILLNKHGKLSIPLLLCKLKVSYQQAKSIMEYFDKEKNSIN